MLAVAPLRLELSGESLVANWRELARRSGAAACGAAIKADGYGLGAGDVARRLAMAGCRDFFVSTWWEAERLGTMPEGATLSVLHGVREADMPVARDAPARPVLNSAAQVARWKAAGGGICDVMVDSGMNRLGLRPEEACSGLLEGLRIDTLMSHLACGDEPDHPLNRVQLDRFTMLRDRISARRYSLANSAGIFLGRDYAFDLTRPGLAIYGGSPMPTDPEQQSALRRVVAIGAEVLQVRSVPAGESVGYGAQWVAPADTQVAILNVGYADGLLRPLGATLVARSPDGAVLPLIGRISMDLIAVDLAAAMVKEGDWLSLEFDVPTLATFSGLSQYELLTGLGSRFAPTWRN